MPTKVACISLLVLLAASSCFASTESINLDLATAISLALDENLSLQMDRKAYELDLQEQTLAAKIQPKLTLSTTPISYNKEKVQSPTANITLDIPLTKRTNISGGVAFSIPNGDFMTNPSASLTSSYTYNFFAPQTPEATSDIDRIKNLDNDMIITVSSNMIRLQKALDNLAREELRLSYLQQVYQAAEIKDNIGETRQLNTQIRTCEQAIATEQANINQTRRQLGYLTNTSDRFNPVIDLPNYQITDTETELLHLAQQNSQLLRSAKESVTIAQANLDTLVTSHGWDVQAASTVNLMTNSDSTFLVKLTASKQLFSLELEVEKAQLKLDQAQLKQTEIVRQINDELQQKIDALTVIVERKVTLDKQLATALVDYDTTQKHYTVGLATQLDLAADELNIFSFKKDLKHCDYDYFLSSLQLLNQVGYDLRDLFLLAQGEGGV